MTDIHLTNKAKLPKQKKATLVPLAMHIAIGHYKAAYLETYGRACHCDYNRANKRASINGAPGVDLKRLKTLTRQLHERNN